MKRLDVIRETLGQLDFSRSESPGAPVHHFVSRSTLIDLMDCLNYICFPEYTTPPPKVMPPYMERSVIMEWVLSFTAEFMTSQIYFAFVLHGDESAVANANEFKPAQTTERIPLRWRTPFKDCTAQRHEAGGNSGDADSSSAQNTNKANNRAFLTHCREKAEAIVTKFLRERLAHVCWLLRTDVEAIFMNDVAATSPSEVVLCYPGVRCMVHQRIAHQLHLLGVPTNFTRMLTEVAHSTTGIDIHPTTAIGHHFFIDHGTGIVIGATAIIGNNVSIYQGVTLGAKSFPVDKKTGEKVRNLPRHPIIEDNVTVYANSVVLGRVTIGKGSVIGGNCWIVRDVPPYTSVVQKSNRVLQPHERMFLEKDGSGI